MCFFKKKLKKNHKKLEIKNLIEGKTVYEEDFDEKLFRLDYRKNLIFKNFAKQNEEKESREDYYQ